MEINNKIKNKKSQKRLIKISEKLNVLFIITDQQRADHLGCAGNPVLKTPNLDELAKDGKSRSEKRCSGVFLPQCRSLQFLPQLLPQRTFEKYGKPIRQTGFALPV